MPRFQPKRIKYTAAQFQEAYRMWASLSPERWRERQAAWDVYCDIRDGHPPGTSEKIRLYADPFLGKAAAGVHNE